MLDESASALISARSPALETVKTLDPAPFATEKSVAGSRYAVAPVVVAVEVETALPSMSEVLEEMEFTVNVLDPILMASPAESSVVNAVLEPVTKAEPGAIETVPVKATLRRPLRAEVITSQFGSVGAHAGFNVSPGE